MLPYSAKGYNLIPDITRTLATANCTKKKTKNKQKKTALTHHDRFQAFVNQLSIDLFTPDFLHAQTDAASHCEGKSICAWPLCLLRYCCQSRQALPTCQNFCSTNLHKHLQYAYPSVARNIICAHMDFRYTGDSADILRTLQKGHSTPSLASITVSRYMQLQRFSDTIVTRHLTSIEERSTV